MTTESTHLAPAPGTAPAAVRRQQVLVLYLGTSALDSNVVGWSLYDGTGLTSPTTGDSDERPYESGLAALHDGWRLIQAAQLIPPHPGHEYDVSFLKHEFFFERICDVRTDRP
ncbi:hypothetical protein [Streptomyces sp. ME19-01-6]|uniref:hypothetical protein n=1 Tax=Streptomyces sp. ME19-01-6 TaxID=3028686 RepID=UPI0029A9E469|nr:hypothetical protein [Streptomyces sp. ME19-01-6]MDX3228138.1 hypothetical protein [Streptomyces sp. ME19-01-6]